VNYGELKSAWMAYMMRLKIQTTLFECVEWLDKSELFIASALPSPMVHELVSVFSSSPADDALRDISLPADYLSLISAKMATERDDETDTPKYRPCPILEPSEYLLKVQWSSERMCAVFNKMIHFNPAPAIAVEGEFGSVELVYKRRPKTVYDRDANFRRGIRVSLTQSSDNIRIFETTGGNTWSDYSIDLSDLFGGQFLWISNSASSPILGEIDSAWDDDGGTKSYIHLIENSPCFTQSGTLTGCMVLERQVNTLGGTPIYRHSSESPEISDAYHGLILDYAIGSYLAAMKPEIGKGYLDGVMQAIASVGGQVDAVKGSNR